jgi:hypothetical protein
MQFNEFQRRLAKCEFNIEAQFLLSHMFEVQVEFSRAIDQITLLMEQLVNRMQEVMTINNETMRQLAELKRRGMMDGVDVHSVVPDPEDDR